jgi:hypothetical protein
MNMNNQHSASVLASADEMPSVQQRWENIENWIQNTPSEELRTLYNSIEVGPVTIVTDEEVQRLREKYGMNGDGESKF